MPQAVCFAKSTKGENMNADEMFLRDRLLRWELRFVEGNAVSLHVLIALQNDFVKVYGLDELGRIKQEIYLEALSKMSPASRGI